MDYVVVSSKATKGAAKFTGIKNYPDYFELDNAKSLRDTFPSGAALSMDPTAPNDIALADCLHRAGSVLVVNEKTAGIFDAELGNDIELLPIKVIDHKGKPVKDSYFVVNILKHIDCIDPDNCPGLEWNDINPEAIAALEQLVIKPDAIPSSTKLFRPKRMTFLMLMHRSLADKIEAEGLKGFRFTELDEFVYP